jgi:protein O-mannosyl-transferase
MFTTPPSESGLVSRPHLLFPLGRGALMALVALLILTAGIFAQVRGFDFLNFDDDIYLTANPHVNQGLTLEGVRWAFSADLLFESPNTDYWQPVTAFSRMLDVELFGLNPGAHHLMNLAIHLGSVALLFIWLRLVTGENGKSAAIAFLFALHPVQTESVAWITERKDVLFVFFGLLSILHYTFHVRGGNRAHYILSIWWFVLSIMSKPMIIPLPLLLMLLDFWPLRRVDPHGLIRMDKKTWRPLLINKVPFFILALASFYIIWRNPYIARHSLADLQFLIPERYVWYVTQFIFPDDLYLRAPSPVVITTWTTYLVSLCLVVGATWICVRQLPARPWLSVGWLWFLFGMTPIHPGLATAERFLYFPGIGLSMIVVYGGYELLSKIPRLGSRAIAAISIVFAMVLCWRTYSHLGVWRNSITLFEHAIRHDRNHFLAHDQLGMAYASSDLPKATRHFQESVQILPHVPKTHYQLGLAFQMLGRTLDAIREYKVALRLDPFYAEALNNLAWIHATSPEEQFHDPKAALVLAERSLKCKKIPAYQSYDTLAAAYASAGRFEEALRASERAIDLTRRAGDEGFLLELEARHQLYLSGKAYLERSESK